MPRVISYTPSWLSRPSPGFQLFAQSQSRPNSGGARGPGSKVQQNGKASGRGYIGPTRTIATRGTEVFVVVDNEIRWSDLCMLRDGWEEQQQQKTKANGNEKVEESEVPVAEPTSLSGDSYKVLKVPVSERIRQLKISPNGYLLAIATSHTVHIAVLPEPSHLGQAPGPIRLKTHMVGPTIHVLSQSSVASVLWHPYGVAGNCLVTTTADAVVRAWELDRSNRLSFDTPSLAVDLRKLSVAASQEDDTTPHRIGRNRGFSTDDIGMDVASTCFGGTGSGGESAWSAMTLWVAMKEGDVYALCPLLPSKWQPSPTTLPSLSTAIVSKNSLLTNESSPELADTRQSEEQYNWISNIDGQTPVLLPGVTEFFMETEVYSRPAHPGPTPALQGPFQLLPGNLEEELELSDIHVIAAKIDAEELLVAEDLDSESGSIDEGGLSASIICLMTKSGMVYLCLDLEGVEGQWLPRTRPSHVMSLLENPYLIVFEAFETLDASEVNDAEWPTFSFDASSRYSFFITNSRAVYFFSLEPWLQILENEFQGSGIGTPFRIEVFKNGPGTLRERIFLFKRDKLYNDDIFSTACVVLQDPDLGYFLLTASEDQPQAATLDIPESQLKSFEIDAESLYEEEQATLLSIGPARSAYQPSSSLWQESALTGFLDRHVPNRHLKIMKEEVRLSHATLDLMTEAHRILSRETHQLGLAAADLFRRCERLQIEFREQIKRVKETAEKIDQVLGEDADDYESSGEKMGKEALSERLEAARERQKILLARYEETRKKSTRLGGRDLSEKEQAWAAEIDQLKQSLLDPEDESEDNEEHDHPDEDDTNQNTKPPETHRNSQQPPPQEFHHRHATVKSLLTDLLSHIKDASRPKSSDPNRIDENDDGGGSEGEPKVSLSLRKKKVEMVMGLLERQSALVEAAQARLERLSLGVVV